MPSDPVFEHQNSKTSESKGPWNVWVERLELGSTAALFAIFFRHGRFNLYFTDAGRPGVLLAAILRALGILAGAPSRVEFTRGHRVDNPEGPRLRAQAQTPNSYTAEIVSAEPAVFHRLSYPDLRVEARRVELNLQKEVATSTFRLLQLVEFARYWHARRGDEPAPLAVISPDAALAAYRSPLPDDPSVKFLSPWTGHHSLLLRMARALSVYGRQMLRRRQPSRSLSRCVATEFFGGLDNINRSNDLSWWWGSNIAAERVLLIFDRADHPPSPLVVDQAQNLGIRCVALSPEVAGGMSNLVWQPAPGIATAARRLWREVKISLRGFKQGPVGRWAAVRLVDVLHNSARLEDFLTEYNVSCLFHYQDMGSDYLSIACDATGTTRMGVHWSYFPWPETSLARINQVYFVWGSNAWETLKDPGSCVDHVIASGCLVKGAYPADPCESEMDSHRAMVARNGATRVLTLFDTTAPCDGFYEFFLRKVIQDPNWGLLIKPKYLKLPWLQPQMTDLQDLYREALATGRVQLLDWQLSPAEAAAAADFSVGVDINSAVVVAALAGHRAIHMDYLRLHESPLSKWAIFYKAGPDRLVFDDPDKLWDRLNRYFDEPGSDPDLGIADEELLRQIDPFRDGKAGQRIGDYVRWYLEGLDRGDDRDEALAEADLRYSGRWGADTVIQGHLGPAEAALAGSPARPESYAAEGRNLE